MHIRADDITIHAFTPSDGSESAAIKVIYRQSGKEFVNDSTVSQVDNLRLALKDLVSQLNPNPDLIGVPKLYPFDHVKVVLPQSFHEGEVKELKWNFQTSEWRYYVQCPESRASAEYVIADLTLVEE